METHHHATVRGVSAVCKYVDQLKLNFKFVCFVRRGRISFRDKRVDNKVRTHEPVDYASTTPWQALGNGRWQEVTERLIYLQDYHNKNSSTKNQHPINVLDLCSITNKSQIEREEM